VTDNCPSCCYGPNEPVATVENGPHRHDDYRCSNCGETWTTHRITTCYPATAALTDAA